MDLKEKFFEWGDGRKLKSVKAIVIHWDASRGIPDIDFLWKWMDKRGVSMRADGQTAPYYHYLVSHQKVINSMEKQFRAIHCGHRTYRKKAKEFFGERVCSSLDSPNNYTIGVCMLHDVEGTGGYHADTMETAVELLAWLCSEYSLDPYTQILRHSDITNEKAVPCPKAFFEDDDDPDDLFNSFKGWVSHEMDGIKTKRDSIRRNV
jgi:N-acetyl-anhydromuramyl-L-alanine amidase AmpD